MNGKNCKAPAPPVQPERFRCVVLIPHRDAHPPLRRWQQRLFHEGFEGAYAFPLAVPLARVSRPAAPEDLAALAQALREAALASSADGKIAARPPAVYGPAWGAWRTYGLPLNIPEPARPQDARGVSRPLSPLILPLALIPPGAEAPAPGAEAPAVAFRAAAVANLIFQALPLAGGGYYYQWETGKPRWLRGG